MISNKKSIKSKSSAKNNLDTDLYVRILKALENPKYKARTISGIVKEANVSKKNVMEFLRHNKKLKEELKVYPRRRNDKKILLTTKRKFDKEATFKEKFIDLFSTYGGGIDNVE